MTLTASEIKVESQIKTQKIGPSKSLAYPPLLIQALLILLGRIAKIVPYLLLQKKAPTFNRKCLIVFVEKSGFEPPTS